MYGDRFFPSPPAFEGFPMEYSYNVWCGKTRMAWLLDGEKFENILTSFDRIHKCDGQSDGQTDTV